MERERIKIREKKIFNRERNGGGRIGQQEKKDPEKGKK